jgi:hypothetical protein
MRWRGRRKYGGAMVLGNAPESLGDLKRSLLGPTGDKVARKVGGKSGTTTARRAGVDHTRFVPRVRELENQRRRN